MTNPSKFGMQTVMGGIQITAAPPGAAGAVGQGMSAADFDRFAAQIRPIWELDDAPFAATAAMDAVDLAALQGGGGANAEVAAALMNGGTPDVLSSDLLVTEPVLPFAAPSSEPMDAPAAQFIAQPAIAQPAQQRAATNGVSHHSSHPAPSFAQQQQALPTAVRPRAQQISASSYLDDDVAIKKSKAPLIIGVVVALAVVGIIIGGMVGLSGPSTTATPDKPAATTPVTTAAPKDIPPPPPVADLPAPPEPTTPVAVAPPVAPAHVASLPPLPPATHVQAAPPPKPPAPPPHTIPPALRPPPAGAKPPKAGGGIVRDNPF